MYLVGFENRILVLTKWFFDYVTHNRGARPDYDVTYRRQSWRQACFRAGFCLREQATKKAG